MNDYKEGLPGTPERTRSEGRIDTVRLQGGVFVEAVRLTRMPMIVTDAALPGNPIIFANDAFLELSGYSYEEIAGQSAHFMDGEATDRDAIARYEAAMVYGHADTVDIVQYRKDGAPLLTVLFASPLRDDHGVLTHHFLSYLDVTRRHDAEEGLRRLSGELENRVAARTRELEDANQRLSKLAAERELLMAEVNHRAKNSLAVAAALLGVQARRSPDPDVRPFFAQAEARLHAMARVHDLLSKSDSVQEVDLARYILDLCEALRSVTEEDARICLEVKAEPGIVIRADTAFPLGIVMTELVTNAVKYAFPEPRSGVIRAEARRDRPGWVELLIADNGVGMVKLREGALGYGLVRSLVRQFGGEIEVRGDAGVRVRIVFPERGPPAD